MNGLPRRGDIAAVLLDAGGVLVNPDWARVAHVLAEHGIVVSPVALGAGEALAKKRLDTPQIIRRSTDESRAATYFGLVVEEAGFCDAVPAAAWQALKAEHARKNLWRTVLPGVPAALDALRAAGLRLAVVSNANGTVQQLFDELGLSAHVDLLLDSFVEGVEKPDPVIFARALQRLGVPAERALHVGDFYQLDVMGARAAGVSPVLIDAGGHYGDVDCPRFSSLPEFTAAWLAA
jgi:putative hydrolase of the HAD superfamily